MPLRLRLRLRLRLGKVADALGTARLGQTAPLGQPDQGHQAGAAIRPCDGREAAPGAVGGSPPEVVVPWTDP